MTQVPDISTERLCLRAFVRDDAEDVFAYASDPAVLLYTTGRTPQSIQDTQKFVNSLLNKPCGAYAWAVRLTSQSHVIGAVEFGPGDGTDGSIHYALAKEYWNRGLMTEACRAVLDWAFRSHRSLESVTTSAVIANRGSTRVMEKCLMQFQRRVKEKWEKFDHPVELAVYSIERQRWQSSQQRAPADADKRSR